MDLATKEDLQVWKDELLSEIRELLKGGAKTSPSVKSRGAMDLLQCSESKLISLRTSGKLPSKKVDGTYYYSTSDIDKLLAIEEEA